MDKLASDVGIGGLAGLVGVLAGWFGIRTKVTCLEKHIEKFSKSVRYEDTCNEISGAIKDHLKNIEEMNTEMRKDIKTLLREKQ